MQRASRASVVLNSFTDTDEDHKLAEELGREFGVDARYIKADMSKGDECRALIEAAQEEARRVVAEAATAPGV